MRINHRIPLEHDHPMWREIDELGLDYDRRSSIIHVLNITEDAPDWSYVKRLCALYAVETQMSNLFAPSEIAEAEWLELLAKGHHGYPMPDDDFGYRGATYELKHYCERCGIGAVQKAPFRIRREFTAPRSHFLQLNWVFDEFFLRTAVAATLEAHDITGFSPCAPMLHARNQPSQDVVQMRINTQLAPAIDVTNLERVTCKPHNEEWLSTPPSWRPPESKPYCGKVKYHGKHRGPFRLARAALANAPDVVKTAEWFGGGAHANRMVLVSRRFRQLVTNMGWRGVSFEPIELTDGTV